MPALRNVINANEFNASLVPFPAQLQSASLVSDRLGCFFEAHIKLRV